MCFYYIYYYYYNYYIFIKMFPSKVRETCHRTVTFGCARVRSAVSGTLS